MNINYDLASETSTGPKAIGRWDRFDFIVGVFIAFAISESWLSPFFGYNDISPEGGLINLIWFPCYGGVFFLLARAPKRACVAIIRSILIFAIISYCLASTYWSVDSTLTMRRSILCVFTALAGIAIAARFEWPRLMEILSTTFAIIMAWCLIMVAAFNHVGIMTGEFVGAWRGVFAEKNSLGGYMAIGFLSCSSAGLLNPKRRIMWLLFASLAAFLVLKSTSKTSLLALIIGMGMMGLVVIARRGPIKAVIVAWASLIVLVLSTFILVADPIILLKILGRDATLTGRTIIWKAIERVSMEKPDFGYGYGAVWTTRGIWSPYYKIGIYSGFHPQTAHSAWSEIKLGLGLWGLVMWVLILIQAWLTGLWRSFRDGGGYFALPFLAIYGLMSISESIALWYNELRWMMFVMVFAKLTLREPPVA